MRKEIVMIAIGAALIFSGCSETINEKPMEQRAFETKTVNLLESPFYISTSSYEETGSDLASDSDDDDIDILTKDEIELIALLTMAEAEDECEYGKRLVIDTVLNRVDSANFPDTVEDVIFEPYQFPSMTNGRAYRCEINSDICEMVKEESKERACSECVYFNSGGYPTWGKPLFRVQNHYFSGEETYYE